MEEYIGKFLDNRYELLEVIGSGGMAVVYKARCHRLNRLVAVKILKSELAQDEEFRRRFHDESQAVAMLSHPNIVAVYDVSRSSELDYIVMELIDGITLKQYMQKKGGPLNWREALHFITQIMRALSHAHSRGIIHRDIKPHNVMVLRDGSVKVADFGIARLASAAQNTLTQEALGSVHYISPEQARGSHIDARSDIYSAGVVLYEMITGRLPFEGESAVSVAIQHINSVPLSPRELNPEIPEALEAITQKAMATNMDQRYVSADAMLADLEEFRKNPSINFDYSTDDLRLDANGDEPTRKISSAEVIAGAEQERRRAEQRRKRAREDEEYDQEYD
ncbi:MAG: protein kinase, partial [Oscillospiraceae bacterium]